MEHRFHIYTCMLPSFEFIFTVHNNISLIACPIDLGGSSICKDIL